jgi:hypothetical protein
MDVGFSRMNGLSFIVNAVTDVVLMAALNLAQNRE